MSFEDLALGPFMRGAAILVAGWFAAHLARRAILAFTEDKFSAHANAITARVAFYIIIVLFVVTAATQFGFDLTILLGAAGIASVAIGFASQTSASNLISGLFLLVERSFGVGDVIKAGDVTGEVVSIDMLSVKLRTFDNLYVRIPNENLMKSTTTTLTRFPIRRYDLQVGIAYGEDIRKARDVLLQVAEDYHLCLEDPQPLIIMQGFGDSSINIQFSVWATRENFLEVRNGMHERVKAAFDEAGIEIPYPHRTLYTGSHTTPFPVTVVAPANGDGGDKPT